jgi:hypothetical protein
MQQPKQISGQRGEVANKRPTSKSKILLVFFFFYSFARALAAWREFSPFIAQSVADPPLLCCFSPQVQQVKKEGKVREKKGRKRGRWGLGLF